MSTTNSDSNHSDTATDDQSDDHPCPTCGKAFDTRKKMKIHHSRSHGERVVETATCDYCGEAFEPTNKGVYCSVECRGAAERKRVALECDHCGAGFEVPQHRADRARFCSHECRAAAQRKPATVDCDHCGADFDVQQHRADEVRFCSVRCSTQYRRDRVRLECEQCARPFYVHPCNDDQQYCCPACRYEAQRTTPREFDDTEALLRQLYVDEDHNHTQTFRRQRAVLGEDDALLKTEVRDSLIEMGVFERAHQRILAESGPDAIGGPAPDGDDSWEEFYGGEADD